MRPLIAPAALFFCILATCTARAQMISVYGTYSPVRASNVQTGLTQTSTGSQNQFTSFWASGVGGGVTFRLIPLPLVSLGLDLRGSTKPGTVGADTAMAGLKLSVHPPVIRIKPYIQGSVGYLAARTTNESSTTSILGATVVNGGTFTNQYLGYEVIGGIDYPLVRFFDLRVIEVGGGKAYNISANADASIFTLNTGLVFHF